MTGRENRSVREARGGPPVGSGDQVQELSPHAVLILAAVGGAITLGLIFAAASPASTPPCGEYWLLLGVGAVLLIGGLVAGRLGQLFVLVILGVIGVLLIAAGVGSLYAQSCPVFGM
jgi:hypothetical protein